MSDVDEVDANESIATVAVGGTAAAAAAKEPLPKVGQHDVWTDAHVQRAMFLFRKTATTRSSAHLRLLGGTKPSGGAVVLPDDCAITKEHFASLHSCRDVLNFTKNGSRFAALIDRVFQRRSVISGRLVPYDQLRLVTWNPEMPLAISNIVLVSNDESMPHNLAIKNAHECAPYSVEIMQHVAARCQLIDGDDEAIAALPPYSEHVERGWLSVHEMGYVTKPEKVRAAVALPLNEADDFESQFGPPQSAYEREQAEQARLKKARRHSSTSTSKRLMAERHSAKTFIDGREDEVTVHSDDDKDDTGSDLEDFIDDSRRREKKRRRVEESSSEEDEEEDEDFSEDGDDDDESEDDDKALCRPAQQRNDALGAALDQFKAGMRSDLDARMRCLRESTCALLSVDTSRLSSAQPTEIALLLDEQTPLGNSLRTLLARAIAGLARQDAAAV